MGQVREYDAKMDTKRRVTLRGARFERYHVKEFEDGRIELEPQKIVVPFELSRRTLVMMDVAVESLKKAQASEPVDLSAFQD